MAIAIGSLAILASATNAADAPITANHKLEAATSKEMRDGEVRKVDKETNKVTLKHGEIKNLGMPGITMVFQVKDPAMLNKLQPGDKVKFHAEKEKSAIVVTDIQSAK